MPQTIKCMYLTLIPATSTANSIMLVIISGILISLPVVMMIAKHYQLKKKQRNDLRLKTKIEEWLREQIRQ
jgi:hypothetical protein